MGNAELFLHLFCSRMPLMPVPTNHSINLPTNHSLRHKRHVIHLIPFVQFKMCVVMMLYSRFREWFRSCERYHVSVSYIVKRLVRKP